jgi:hypothetical protein
MITILSNGGQSPPSITYSQSRQPFPGFGVF